MEKFFLTRSEIKALRQTYRLLEVDRRRFFLAVILGSLGLGAAVALGGSSAWLIARASQMPPVLYLEVCVVLVRFFGISKAVFRYLERLVSHRIAVGGMATLRANVYDQLSQADPAQISRLKRGDLLERMGNDVNAVGDFVVKSLLPAAVALTVGLSTVLAISLIDLQTGMALAGALFLAGVIAPIFSIRAIRIANKSQMAARTAISETTMQIMDGAAQLNISGQGSQILQVLDNHESRLNESKDRAAYPAATAAAIDLFSMLLAVLAAAWFGIHGVGNHAVSHVMLAVLVLTPLSAFEATAPLGAAAAQLVVSAQSAKRIIALLPTIPELPGQTATDSQIPPAAGSSASLDTNLSTSSAAPSAAAAPTSKSTAYSHTALPANTAVLEVQQASIGWPNYPTLLDNLNFTITPGTSLAIVGQSGIGKTTLLATLSGMIAPQRGHVKWCGEEISLLPREKAAQSICLISEDDHIFETTVLENLRVAKGSLSREQAQLCLQKAGLGTWLEQLPDGLDTTIGSGATTISGGERRRILLARGLASSAPILAFDEPTEHLDPATADRLLADFLQLADSDRALILVTHRLATMPLVDQIIVLGPNPEAAAKIGETVTAHVETANVTAPTPQARNRVVAKGTHEELLASHEGYRWSWEQEQVDRWD